MKQARYFYILPVVQFIVNVGGFGLMFFNWFPFEDTVYLTWTLAFLATAIAIAHFAVIRYYRAGWSLGILFLLIAFVVLLTLPVSFQGGGRVENFRYWQVFSSVVLVMLTLAKVYLVFNIQHSKLKLWYVILVSVEVGLMLLRLAATYWATRNVSMEEYSYWVSFVDTGFPAITQILTAIFFYQLPEIPVGDVDVHTQQSDDLLNPNDYAE